ncbi:Transcriptional regulator/sugar kinase [Nocardioides sp. PD653]|nr:Transcriptional regulator/sugar kinase [Nocardioides sp. PD653-B2]GAW54382.1 Transcriptional regulator/sugar kinase [Nocardioides sp. PD653]
MHRMAGLDPPRDVLAVVQRVRELGATTRADLGRSLGLGRGVVNQRLGVLRDLGLVEEGDIRSSSGGRAPRELRFRGVAGYVLVADLDASAFAAGVSDLTGRLVATDEVCSDIADGPALVLDRVADAWERLCRSTGIPLDQVWGIGLGVPGPVEFATGRPIAPPIMPGWDAYDVREHLGARFSVPVWVDNEVNLEALGEARAGSGAGVTDMVFVKLGVGIGAGVISGSRLHRGAQGAAGDIGHVAVLDDDHELCRCGNTGCLEVVAGGAALIRRVHERGAGPTGEAGPRLGSLVAAGQPLAIADITSAGAQGDPLALDLLTQSARLVGGALATLVNFFNPSLLVVGGDLVQGSDLVLSTIRESVYGRSLPLATRNLVIGRSGLGLTAGLVGAAAMTVDELLADRRFHAWAPHRSPHGHPEIASIP